LTRSRLRIAQVCPYSLTKRVPVGVSARKSVNRPGGVQNHVLGLADWLRSRGHLVKVFAPDAAFDLTGGNYPNLVPEDLVDVGHGLAVPYNGSSAPICFGPHSAGRLRGWLGAGQFDVVHVHEPEVPGVSLLATWASPEPVIATFHTDAQDSKLIGWALRHVPGLPSGLVAGIAVSPIAAAVAYRRLGVRPVIIPNGIPGSYFKPHRSAIDRAPLAVFVGRYDEPRKGLATLLAAMPLLRRRHPGFRLQVLGPGHPVPVSGVEYLGTVSDQQRTDLLSRADVLVAPSLGSESFGIVLLEALAVGTAVVASSIAGYRSVLRGQGTAVGELFEPGDPEALAAAVEATLALPPDPVSLQRFAAGFSWAKVGPQVENLYYEQCQTT
jgi:phosphatidylinositol alpha-mannosyltransferase